MGALRFWAWGFAVCIALAGGVADADELVLPYTCTVDKGVPHLFPSDIQSYPIIGTRVDQPFTACASSAAWTCETMMVHKFMIECGGQRVPWSKVAVSARAFGVVIPDHLPSGYAPVSRLQGRFIFPAFGKSAAIPRVTSESLSRDAVIEPAAPRPEVQKAAWVTSIDPVAVPVSSRSALKIAGVVSMLLVSLMGACLLLVRRRQTPAFEFSAGPVEAESAGSRMRDFAAALFQAFRRRVHDWQNSTEEITGDPVISEILAPVRARLHETEIVVSMLPGDLLLRNVLLSELDGVNQRLADLERRFRNLELDRVRSVVRAALRDLDRIDRIARGARPVASEGVQASPREAEIPSTAFEAYRILGLNPDAPDAAVKKIVDALRMSWHPDHARDEVDRHNREQRIKQVNAAWDLLKTRPAEAA